MTPAEFQARKDAIIEEAYAAIGGDDGRAKLSDAMLEKLIIPGVAVRMQAECERNPEFEKAYRREWAEQDLEEFFADRRPIGTYREDGWLKLDRTRYVEMPKATRDHLLTWALNESDERNLFYIKSRLDLLDKHPEIRTLGDLEGPDVN